MKNRVSNLDESYEKIQILFEIAFIFYPIIRSFLNFLIPIFGLNDYSMYIYFFAGLIVVLYSLPDIIKILRFRDFFIYFVCILLYELSRLFYPKNTYWVDMYQFEFLFCIFPYFFLGMAIDYITIRYEKLFRLSRIGIVVQAITLVVHKSNSGQLGEQMGKAYTVLPLIMLLTYSLFENKNKRDFLFVGLGCICLLVNATRGPIFLYIVFIGIMTIVYKNFKLLIILVLGGVIYFVDEIRNGILLYIIGVFNNSGFNTRVFDYILANDATNLNYRDVAYYAYVKNMIKQNPFGNGIFADRRAINYGIGHEATYTHNIVLELQCQYGIIVGTILLALIILYLIKGIVLIDKNKKIIYIILTTVYFGKLFFSSSYLLERWFFVLLGLAYVTVSKRRRIVFRLGGFAPISIHR